MKKLYCDPGNFFSPPFGRDIKMQHAQWDGEKFRRIYCCIIVLRSVSSSFKLELEAFLLIVAWAFWKLQFTGYRRKTVSTICILLAPIGRRSLHGNESLCHRSDPSTEPSNLEAKIFFPQINFPQRKNTWNSVNSYARDPTRSMCVNTRPAFEQKYFTPLLFILKFVFCKMIFLLFLYLK